MAEEQIPENVDLKFIAAQLGKVLDGQRGMRGQIGELQDGQRELRADVKGLQVAMAATRTDIGIIKADVEAIRQTQLNHGVRFNAIEGRLALIEKNTVLVKV